MRVSETDGKPIRPLLKTLDVNLTGAIYSELDSHPRCLSSLEFSSFVPIVATQLALHYLPKTWNQASPLKYVVFLGFLGMVVSTRPTTALLTMASAEKRRGMRIRNKRSSLPLSTGCSASRDRRNRLSPLRGSASRRSNPHLPQVSSPPVSFVSFSLTHRAQQVRVTRTWCSGRPRVPSSFVRRIQTPARVGVYGRCCRMEPYKGWKRRRKGEVLEDRLRTRRYRLGRVRSTGRNTPRIDDHQSSDEEMQQNVSL